MAAAGSAAFASVFAVWAFARVVDPAAAVSSISGSIPTHLPANVAVLHGIMSFLLLLALQWLAEMAFGRPVRESQDRSSEAEVVP